MKLVVFGLSISSSWGNGHATLWRGLCAALARRGHQVIFFERDVPYYAAHRDYSDLPNGKLILYDDWIDVAGEARRQIRDADVAMTTSYCADAIAALEMMADSGTRLKVFYDMDAPVTLARLAQGATVEYIGPRGLRDFDLVLSFTGGPALEQLRTRLGARRVQPLYGSVDPFIHAPVTSRGRYRADLSYLGTFSPDRDEALRMLFLSPAAQLPKSRFVLGGAQYDGTFPWQPNIYFCDHVRAADHPAFYCSARLTLNVTRRQMADMGYCPSGRLFEATACGAPVLTDFWEGLDQFFQPGTEVLVARGTADVLAALQRSDSELKKMAAAGRERTLSEHTADARAARLEKILERSLYSERAEVA